MIRIIVCLSDKASGSFMQPMFVPAIGVAYRNIQDEIRRGGDDNVLSRHAGDFSIYKLGTFDDESGAVVAGLEKLVECSSLVEKE